MFFAILCLILTVMLVSGHPPDQYGWMMLVGVSWFTGYLDCRRFGRSDQEKDRIMPPDAVADEPVSDSHLFRT